MRVLPEPDDLTRFYWEAARNRELHIQRCQGCGRYHHPPVPKCTSCDSDSLAGERVSGRGVVHTYTVTHRDVPGKDVPFVVAYVELEEQSGLRVVANVLDCAVALVRCGLPVEVTFEAVTEEVTLPQFRPREEVVSP